MRVLSLPKPDFSTLLQDERQPASFFAVVIPVDGSAPNVREFPDTPDGRRRLQALLVGENVLRLIKGTNVPFTTHTAARLAAEI